MTAGDITSQRLADLEVGLALRWQELDRLDREADDEAFALITSTR